MAIDSPLLRQLRQREQENLRIADGLKRKRLKIEAEIAEIDTEIAEIERETAAIERETEAIERETEAIRSETEKLLNGNARLLSMLCEALASKSTTHEAALSPSR